GLIWRFSNGRSQVYRNTLERLPVVSDDFSMTHQIPRPAPPRSANQQASTHVASSGQTVVDQVDELVGHGQLPHQLLASFGGFLLDLVEVFTCRLTGAVVAVCVVEVLD